MRKLASVVRIKDCNNHPNADRLSVVTMEGKGWTVITGRDEFTAGEVAVYFEIDSFLPASDGRYEFLKDRCLRKFVSKSGEVLREGIRIKTLKLRGVISQGLLIPICRFPEIVSDRIGDDVSSILSVAHYDEVAESLRFACGGNSISADTMGKFPTEYVPKTDEERIQNLSEYFISMKGRRFEVTEKNDGSSVTMFFSRTIDAETPFGVCSRNLRLKPMTATGAVSLAWKMADKYSVQERLNGLNDDIGCEFAIQGELVGPGVNGNRDKYSEFEWHVFKIYDVKEQKYLTPCRARSVCKTLGLTYVRVIENDLDVFSEFATTEEVLRYAEGKTEAGHEREGLVFKSIDYPFVSFKAVSNRYLMSQED